MGNFSWFFSKSIKVQLTVVLFALTALAIIVVGFLGVRGIVESGNQTQAISTDSAKQSAQQFLTQTVAATASKNSVLFQNIQAEVANTAAYTTNVFNNPGGFAGNWKFDSHVFKKPSGQWWNSSSELPNILLGAFITPDATLKKRIEMLHNLDYVALDVLKNEPNAVALYFIGDRGESFYYPNIDLGSIIPPDLNPKDQDFYKIATPQNNPEKTTKWTSVYDDPAGNGLLISAAHPIYTNANGFIGSIIMDVTLSSVAKNIEDYTPIEGSYAFLVDSAGRGIAFPKQAYSDILGRSQKPNEFGPELKDAKSGFGGIITNMRAGKTGFSTAKVDGSNIDVAYAPVAGTGFTLAIAGREASILAVANKLHDQVASSTNSVLFFQILPSSLIILAAIWFVGFWYIRYLTRPLNQLTSATQKIRQGHFDIEEIPVVHNNEIGKLATAFNTMAFELSKSYKTLQKQLRELADGKAKDDAMISSIADGVIVVDHDGNILLVNQATCDLFGMQGADLINKPITKLVMYGDDRKILTNEERPTLQVLKTGKKVTRDTHVMRSKDNLRDIKMTASPIMQEGEVVGAIAILRDITREKEVDRLKTDFISVASHQLRTPLSAIRWFGEMLMNGDAGKLQPSQREFVSNITQSTKRMIELVGSLLNISRLESGSVHIEPKPTDIHELVTDITNDFKTEVDDRHQKLLVEIDPTLPQHIDLDPRLVSQVYVNLLNNAVRYTPNSGNISVKVMRRGNEVVSEVKDTGYGIPKDEQGKVFDRFFRGSNIIKIETDGTGLGLYLVKTIVESSGGKVWYESTENKGTTFSFTLPILAKTTESSK